MSETLQTEHIDIHDSINKKEWVKNKIAEVYEQSNKDLSDLKKDITANALENKITMDHVKNVLQTALDKFTKENKTFSQVYGTKDPIENKEAMSAGLTLSIQIALTKLGYKPGAIDGVYMNPDKSESNTRSAVMAFQKDLGLDQDGWAGPKTITKLLEKLGATPVVTDQGNKDKKDEQKKEEQSQKKEEQKKQQTGGSEVITPVDLAAENAEHLTQIALKYDIDTDFVNNTPDPITSNNTEVILSGKINGKDISIVFTKPDYSHPTLKNGTDKYDLVLPAKVQPSDKQKINLTEKVVNTTEQSQETVLDQLKKQYTITGLETDLVQSGDIVNNKIKFMGRTTSGENIMIQFDITNGNYESPRLIDGDLYYNLNIPPSTTTPKILAILPDNSEVVEKIRQSREIRTRLNNLQLPNEWSRDSLNFDMANQFDIHLNLKHNNQKYPIDFDKNGELKLNQELTVNDKKYTVSISGNTIILTEKRVETLTTQQEIQNILNLKRYPKIGEISPRGNSFVVTISSSENKQDIIQIFNEKQFSVNIADKTTNPASAFKKYELTLTKLTPEQIEANKTINELKNKYSFDESVTISSVEKTADKVTAHCNGFDLQFNTDYNSPTIIYHGNNYPVETTPEANNRKWISLKVENLSSLEQIGQYKDKISIGSPQVSPTEVVFDLYNSRECKIKFTYAGNKYDLSFNKNGILKTQTLLVKSGSQEIEHNVLITPDKKIKIDTSSPKLSLIKELINQFSDVTEVVGNQSSGSLQIKSNKVIDDIISTYEKNLSSINIAKTFISPMDNHNTIKSEFDAMVRKMDLLTKYKTIVNNEQLLKDKGYKIDKGSNGNIISLKKKPLIGQEKIYISNENNIISISSTIDQINQDINTRTFALNNEALKTTLTPFLEGVSFENVVNTVNAIKNDDVRTDIQNFLKDGNIVLAQEYLGMYRNSAYEDNKATGKINEHMLKRLAQDKLLEKGDALKSVLSSDIKEIYTNFLNNNLNNGKNYALISKKDYTLYMFNADHKLLSKHPVLLGRNAGDQVMELRSEGSIFTTPGGIYTIDARAQKNEYAGPGDFLQLKPKDRSYPVNDFSIGIHTFYSAAGEREKLLEKTTSNKRVTNGCINTLLEGSVYDNLSVGSVIYVAKES